MASKLGNYSIPEDPITLSYLVDSITVVEQSQNDAIQEEDKVPKKTEIVIMVVAIVGSFIASAIAVFLMSYKTIMLIIIVIVVVNLTDIISFSADSQH